MAERTLEKELDALKADLENLREGISSRSEKAVKEFGEDITTSMKKHPVKSALISGGVAFFLGMVTAKMFSHNGNGRSRE